MRVPVIGQSQNPYNRIIVCLQGDGKSLAIANKIVEFARRNGVEIGPNVVFARVKDPAINRYLPQGKICTLFTKEQKPDKQSRITVFGDLVGIYAFDCQSLLGALDRLQNHNAQKEYYLTDVPAILRGDGKRVAVYTAALNEQILGVNTPEQLALTERYLKG